VYGLIFLFKWTGTATQRAVTAPAPSSLFYAKQASRRAKIDT
jgi:hypothetical protein